MSPEDRSDIAQAGGAPAGGQAPGGQAPTGQAPAGGNGETRERREGLAAQPPEFCHEAGADLEDHYAVQALDRAFKAQLAHATGGVSPFGVVSTFLAWWVHLLGSPGKQAMLVEKAGRKLARFSAFAASAAHGQEAAPCIEPMAHDQRFANAAWREWPYNLISQGFLLTQQWWHNATNDIEGLSRHQEQVVSFCTRQILDVFSPANYLWTNPQVARTTIEQNGDNLMRGFSNLVEDWQRNLAGKPPVGTEDFRPGRAVAVTPGKVIYRNELIELIQYAPAGDRVQAEPILIVPAWIMKYYILDLSPGNSLVRYLVEQGFTVFMISWRNPTAEQRDLGMDAYVHEGVGAALDAVTAVVPDRKVHAVGYCIGGTLLSIAAAAMARDGDERLKSITLFATQTDFTEAGELTLFISESQVSFLEDMMWDQGFLDTKQMAGAFQLLRSNDLIWSRYIHDYLMGERHPIYDLLAWNADATRMPYRMHTEYLRRIFLNNELAQGRYEVEGKPVAISNITAPIFCVSTTSDHVAPWQSVYKIHLLADTEVTFVLTNGGHNAGIVSEPGHKGRHYRIRTTQDHQPFLAPEAWAEQAPERQGSWWEAWSAWLKERTPETAPPPPMGTPDGRYAPLCAAPGTYVFQR